MGFQPIVGIFAIILTTMAISSFVAPWIIILWIKIGDWQDKRDDHKES